MSVDWLEIRNDYINGGGSYRKIAEKYGVPFGTLKDIAVKEKWAEAKEQNTNKIRTKTEQKTQEKISEALSERAATKARIEAKAIGMVENWINKFADTTEDTGDIRRIIQSCVDMGIFTDRGNINIGNNSEDDELTKALKEEAERMNNAHKP